MINKLDNRKRVLFVCLGNICRSPAAEAVFKDITKKAGVIDDFKIDSAGTGSWHIGKPADKRMREHASKRGYILDGVGRQFNRNSDFDEFDTIIGMDNENIRTLRALARNESDLKKIMKMTDFRKEWSYDEVPDPYYGGAEGFELVLDLLEDSCGGLFEKLMK